MEIKGIRFHLLGIFLFLNVILLGVFPVQAFEPGKTYDSSNWEEIKDIVTPQMLNWVKNGEVNLTTGKLNYEYKHNSQFLEASQKNIGKYDIDPEGIMIDRQSGERVQLCYGLPFPNIDPKDPKAGEKIMENFQFQRFRMNSYFSGPKGRTLWVDGEEGEERYVTTHGQNLFFIGRTGEPLRNPNNFQELEMNPVTGPMDIRGVITMNWRYNDEREDTSFNYLPMLRRVTRVSAASRSDPFMGSDACIDDNWAWGGKNSSFKWKLIGEKTILMPFESPDKLLLREIPDEGKLILETKVKFSFEVEGWQGMAYAVHNVVYTPRPVWVVEGAPKDPYYNYGKHIFYLDKDTFTISYKVVYDKAGQYWKTTHVVQNYSVAFDGTTNIGAFHIYHSLDDRVKHATVSRMDNIFIDLPLKRLSRNYFTTATMLQLSK